MKKKAEIRKIDFSFELAQPHHKFLIYQWLEQKHVQEVLRELHFKDIPHQLEKFFQARSQRYTYWIGYYKNDPFALLVGSPKKNRAMMTVDLIICDAKYQGKWLSTSLMREVWWHLDRFHRL